MEPLQPPSASTKSRIEDPNPEAWRYDRNDKGELLDDFGNVTRNPDRARKIWRETRLPDPAGKAVQYLVTLGDENDPGKRVQQIVLFGVSFPRFVMQQNPDDPRHPQMRLLTIKLAPNQHEALMERAAQTFVRVPPPRDNEGGYEKDPDTGEPRQPKYVKASDLLILERYDGEVAEVGGAHSVDAFRRLRKLEEEVKALRGGTQPDIPMEDQFRQLLYGANLVDPKDTRPLAEIFQEMREAMGSRDNQPGKKPKTH